MAHLGIAVQILVLFAGSASLAFLIYWSVRLHRTYLYLFTSLYFLFTVFLAVSLVRDYALLNRLPYAGMLAYVLYGAASVASFAVLPVAAWCVHSLSPVKRRAAKNGLAACIAAAGAILTVLPASTRFDPVNGTIFFGAPLLVSNGLYLMLFAYVVAAGFIASRRIADRRMKRFASGLLAFAALGFAESLIGAVPVFRESRMVLAEPGGEWILSSLPYAAFGVYLIFHYSPFENSCPPSRDGVSSAFVERFGLSPRESEVASCVLKGWSNEKIAGALFISRGTVKAHLHTIFRKTGCRGRFELMRKASRG